MDSEPLANPGLSLPGRDANVRGLRIESHFHNLLYRPSSCAPLGKFEAISDEGERSTPEHSHANSAARDTYSGFNDSYN